MNKRFHFSSTASLKKKIGLVFFGIFLSLVLLEIGLHAGGFIYSSLQEF